MEASRNPRSSRGKPRLIVFWYGIGALLLLLVAVLSLLPVSGTGVNDKLAHLVTYFILGSWFALLADNRYLLAWTFAGLVAYGGMIELLQGMTSYRDGEWGDLVANSSGVALGVLLYRSPLRKLLLLIDGRLARVFQR